MDVAATRWSRAKARAKFRKMPFEVSLDDFRNIITSPCVYCKGPITGEGGGMDRLDNSRGYELDNVSPCCTECNRVRSSTYTPEEMRRVLGTAMRIIRFFRGFGRRN